MIRMRNSIVQNKALRSQRMMFTTALKQYHRMRTAQRMMRYAMTAITAAVVNVLLYAIIFIFLCGSRSCEVKFLMNQSVSSNPPFFLRLLSPFVCSCGPIKGSRIGFAKFFRRNTTPLWVWRFPRNSLGLETLPFQFAFYLCHRNNQTSGERGQKRCVRGTGSHIQATPVPPLRESELNFWLIGIICS